jgi:toxin-antitoxin system PIN domain toxin
MTLVDVNVWLAAVWARHAQHAAAKRWIDEQDADLVFCRLTEMALLRLTSNPAVTGRDARTRRQAWDLVLKLQADPRVRFVAEPPGLAPLWIAFSKRDDRSHLLWTGDYLAAFALAAGLALVTLDQGMVRRYPSVDVVVLGESRPRGAARL